MTNQEWDDCNELSDLRMENAVLKDKLAAALAENTKLAEQVQANRRAQQPNEPLTLEELRKINEERVWIQFRGLGMYGLVAYRSDPDGDDGDNVYITNNLGGRDTFEEILDQGGTVYARPPEAGEKG